MKGFTLLCLFVFCNILECFSDTDILGDIQRQCPPYSKLAVSPFDVTFKTCLTIVYIAQQILIWLVSRQQFGPSNKSHDKSRPNEIPKMKYKGRSLPFRRYFIKIYLYQSLWKVQLRESHPLKFFFHFHISGYHYNCYIMTIR